MSENEDVKLYNDTFLKIVSKNFFNFPNLMSNSYSWFFCTPKKKNPTGELVSQPKEKHLRQLNIHS